MLHANISYAGTRHMKEYHGLTLILIKKEKYYSLSYICIFERLYEHTYTRLRTIHVRIYGRNTSCNVNKSNT